MEGVGSCDRQYPTRPTLCRSADGCAGSDNDGASWLLLGGQSQSGQRFGVWLREPGFSQLPFDHRITGAVAFQPG
jgi:hypothetical protein